MKKTRLFIVSFLLCLILSVNVSAFKLGEQHQWIDGDITYIGTFKTSLLSDEQKTFMRNWFSSDKTVCSFMASSNIIRFYIFKDNISFSASQVNNMIGLTFVSNNEVEFISFNYQTMEPLNNEIHRESIYANVPYFVNSIISRPLFLHYDVDVTNINPALFIEYDTKYLAFIDDDGLIEVEQPEEPDTGIIGWLKNFWEKLKQLFISIFVPEDGYLQQWYNDIKTAFEKKVGGLSSAFSNLSSAFNSLKTSAEERTKIILTLPDNWIFQGYKGTSVDLLGYAGGFMSFLRNIFNGIILISTIIICYKNLIKTIKT